MVNERVPAQPLQPIMANDNYEPPAANMSQKPANPPMQSSSISGSTQPVFGQSSMPQSGLNKKMPQQPTSTVQRTKESTVFYQPKSRPEHHRVEQHRHPHLHAAKEMAKDYMNPFVARAATSLKGTDPKYSAPSGNPVPIRKPGEVEYVTTRPIPAASYGISGATYGGFQSVNPSMQSNTIDLTSNKFSMFRDTDHDPYTYVDPSKAAEDLKALLEGAIEDEEDMPRTRSRKKKQIEDLTAKIEKMKVGEVVEGEGNEEEDEEEDDGTVEGIKVKLLPHQVEGLSWMQDRELGTGKKGKIPYGGILADDMGLGKTLQAISLIITNPRPKGLDLVDGKRKFPADMGKSTLVVAPLALIRQWELEIKEKVADSHSLRVCVHHGPQRTKRWEDLKRYDVVITTYQILVSEHGNSSKDLKGVQVGCFGIHWYRVILDEAHTIKNRNAKMTQACYALRSQYRWCLTGTPMQNNLEELQSLVKFLRIKPYNDLRLWKEQIEAPMNNGRGHIALQRLRHYLNTFMKRRTKEILKKEGALNPGGKVVPGAATNGFKVTERKVETVMIKFSEDEQRFYERLQARAEQTLAEMMSGERVSYVSALVLLLRLRQTCDHVELVANKVSKDIGALGSDNPKHNTSLSSTAVGDVDEMAELFGNLGVDTKKCDTCGVKLTNEASRYGQTQCEDCEEDLAAMRKKTHKHKKEKKEKKLRKEALPKPARQRKNRNVILDSDDEDEAAGEWLVKENQRGPTKLGKAGGSEDENAEGGGEWLNSEDETDDDLPSPSQIGKKPVKTNLAEDSDTEAESDSDIEDELLSSEGEDDEVTNLTAIGSSTKIKHMLKILRKEVDKQKFIVFSQFTSMLDLIEPFLIRDGIKFARYDGSMRNDMREASLNSLRNNPDCRLLLCSLKCGSLGLNLTAATRVIILEPFWNPFVEEQAIDRVHRLTQKVDVVVYKLIIDDSVEERILALQERKRELAAQAIDGGSKKEASKLGIKEILQLFRHDAHAGPFGSTSTTEPIAPLKGERLLGGSKNNSAASSSTAVNERRVTPPVARSKEHEVYGRRW